MGGKQLEMLTHKIREKLKKKIKIEEEIFQFIVQGYMIVTIKNLGLFRVIGVVV